MDWKVPVIGAAAGLLFSLLGGLIGRIGIFDLIVRSLLAGLLMGGAALGLRMLLVQFIPELFQTAAAVEKDPEDLDDQTPRVDIVLEDGEEDSPASEVPDYREDLRSAPGGELPPVEDFQDFGAGLPDMGGLSSPAPVQEPESESSSGPGAPAGSVEFEGRQEDPAILARAVQTVMKREGES